MWIMLELEQRIKSKQIIFSLLQKILPYFLSFNFPPVIVLHVLQLAQVIYTVINDI